MYATLAAGDGIRERSIKLKAKAEERESEKDEEHISNWGGSAGRASGNRAGESDELTRHDLLVARHAVDVI